MTESELVRVERRTEHGASVTVLRLCAGENRFRPDSLAAISAALDAVETDPVQADAVEAQQAPGALVLTGEGKFFSNGLDLEWMGSTAAGREAVLPGLHALLARLLAFPTVTVAAVNGHAYAGGAMLALACDFRVMRADRGYLCLPEADLGLPFTVGMTALLRARMTPATARAAVVFGTRYGGVQAVEAGLADEALGESEVLPTAVRRAAALAGKDRATVRTIKERLYAEPLAALRTEVF